MIEIFTLLFGLLGSIISWIGIITLLTIIAGIVLPYVVKDAKNIDSKIAIGRFTLLHITKADYNIRVTVFHQHKIY